MTFTLEKQNKEFMLLKSDGESIVTQLLEKQKIY